MGGPVIDLVCPCLPYAIVLSCTSTISASDARQQWSQLLNRIFRREARVIVEESGIPVAAIVSAEDLERFLRFESQWAERFNAMEESREAFRYAPAEEVEREVAKALAAARNKERQSKQRGAA